MAEECQSDDDEDRTLTDADVKAIAKRVNFEFRKSLALDVGMGVLGFVWKAVLVFLLWLAYSSASGSIKLPLPFLKSGS